MGTPREAYRISMDELRGVVTIELLRDGRVLDSGEFDLAELREQLARLDNAQARRYLGHRAAALFLRSSAVLAELRREAGIKEVS